MPESLTSGPTYGDSQRLESVRKEGGTKLTGGTFGDLVQKTPVGRPAAGPMVPVTPVVNQPQGAGVPQEHQAMMEDYATKLKAAQEWANLASAADAGPVVREWAARAQQQAQEAAMMLKQFTPSFL